MLRARLGGPSLADEGDRGEVHTELSESYGVTPEGRLPAHLSRPGLIAPGPAGHSAPSAPVVRVRGWFPFEPGMASFRAIVRTPREGRDPL